MIVTLDTGILVRATSRSNGPAHRLLQAIAGDPAHVLALSPYILGEVGKALSYSPIHRVISITPDEIQDYLKFLHEACRLIEPQVSLPVVLNDPKDDPIVYTAIGGGAQVLCTRDRAFYASRVITFCRGYGIEVMDDLQLLAALK